MQTQTPPTGGEIDFHRLVAGGGGDDDGGNGRKPPRGRYRQKHQEQRPVDPKVLAQQLLQA